MAKIMRHLVSKKKRRFEWGEFDLDLTYITDRIVAMGFPSESLEGLYRNNMKDVQKFFESLHPGRYRIYNLCTERKYDHSKFGGNVAEFPFDDHGPPHLDVIEHFCTDVANWLDAHPENVIGVHCKAGKGRTGTLVSCYLLYSGYCKSASEACRLFGNKRTLNGKGITIPSQYRYVRYFEQMLLQSQPPPAPLVLPPPTTLVLQAILMYGTPNFNIGGGCEPFLGISQSNKSVYASKPLKIKKGTEIVEFDCGETLLSRDVKIQFFNKSSKGKMFSLSFHTGYVTSNRLKLRRLELDRANKDTSHKHFSAHFVVELIFKEMPKSSSNSPGAPQVLNPVFICASCNTPILPDEASVHHMDRNWHWGCLKCHSCNLPLRDDVIFGKDGKPTCSTCDKTTGFFKFCAACGLMINSHISQDVGELSYHKGCFECCDCGRFLGNVTFSSTSNQKLICEPCLTKPTEEETPPEEQPVQYTPPPPSREPEPEPDPPTVDVIPPPAVTITPTPTSTPNPPFNPTPIPPPQPKEPEPALPPPRHPSPPKPSLPPPSRKMTHSRACPGCLREVTIAGDRLVALGTMWHKECFVCNQCRRAFPGGKYYIRNDIAYCQECDSSIRQALLPPCMGCLQFIEDSELTEALGGMWHLECFACAHCMLPIGGPFATRDGKVYCKTDYEAKFCVKCHGCDKVIQGSFFRAMDKAYHMMCFQCIRCGTGLTNGQYFEIGNRPMCFPCKDGTKFAIPEKIQSVSTNNAKNKFLCEHRSDSFRQSRRLTRAMKPFNPTNDDLSPSSSPPMSRAEDSPPDLSPPDLSPLSLNRSPSSTISPSSTPPAISLEGSTTPPLTRSPSAFITARPSQPTRRLSIHADALLLATSNGTTKEKEANGISAREYPREPSMSFSPARYSLRPPSSSSRPSSRSPSPSSSSSSPSSPPSSPPLSSVSSPSLTTTSAPSPPVPRLLRKSSAVSSSPPGSPGSQRYNPVHIQRSAPPIAPRLSNMPPSPPDPFGTSNAPAGVV